MRLKVILDGQEHGFNLVENVDAEQLRAELAAAIEDGGAVILDKSKAEESVTLVGSHIAAWWLSTPSSARAVSF